MKKITRILRALPQHQHQLQLQLVLQQQPLRNHQLQQAYLHQRHHFTRRLYLS